MRDGLIVCGVIAALFWLSCWCAYACRKSGTIDTGGAQDAGPVDERPPGVRDVHADRDRKLEADER